MWLSLARYFRITHLVSVIIVNNRHDDYNNEGLMDLATGFPKCEVLRFLAALPDSSSPSVVGPYHRELLVILASGSARLRHRAERVAQCAGVFTLSGISHASVRSGGAEQG